MACLDNTIWQEQEQSIHFLYFAWTLITKHKGPYIRLSQLYEMPYVQANIQRQEIETTQVTKAEGWQVSGLSELQNEFKASWADETLSQKTLEI